jgi:hypothetical protein
MRHLFVTVVLCLLWGLAGCGTGRLSSAGSPADTTIGVDALIFVRDSGSTLPGNSSGGVSLLILKNGAFWITNDFPLAKGSFVRGNMKPEQALGLKEEVSNLQRACWNRFMSALDEPTLTLGCRDGARSKEVSVARRLILAEGDSTANCVNDAKHVLEQMRIQTAPLGH